MTYTIFREAVIFTDKNISFKRNFQGVLGLFFFTESVMLFENIGYNKGAAALLKPESGAGAEVNQRYQTAAYQCWIAAALYAVTLLGAFWQNKWNTQSLI